MVCLCGSVFIRARNHHGLPGCSTDWQGKLSLSPFLGIHGHSLLSLFNLSLSLPPCDVIQTVKVCYLVMGTSVSLLVLYNILLVIHQ